MRQRFSQLPVSSGHVTGVVEPGPFQRMCIAVKRDIGEKKHHARVVSGS